VEVFNLFDDELPAREDAQPGFGGGRAMLRPLLGGSSVGVSVYELPPGERLWPYHYELNREEWLLVVAGEPTLREPGGERRLRAGDVVCFPVGPEGSHALRNEAGEPVRVVVLAEYSQGAYTTVQPDSDKILVRSVEGRRIIRGSPQLDYWDGEA
jgi:uncharacterized cupin superfamily protein